ncbi:MAG: hexose kinase [Lachnospiraceae bacterium]|nr:hexose kinase [Lachnospiraceae bacterium]
MILCVSLNPAVDRMLHLGAELKPGAVNRISEQRDYAGGKGVNVARVLKELDADPTLTGFAGGDGGELIARTLSSEGIGSALVRTEAPTRCNQNFISPDGTVTELLAPGPKITERERERFLEEFSDILPKSRLLLLSGSLPPGIPAGFYAQLIREARAAGVPAFLDSSGEALREGVAARPFLIKPNRAELEALCGEACPSRDAALYGAELLKERYALPCVALSLGAEGLLYLFENERLFAAAPELDAVSTVGCGDAALASLAHSYLAGLDARESLKWAVARSAAAALEEESGHIDTARAEELADRVQIYTV